jgi:RNA polymerase sigma-70 factor (ECF subfamily)
VGADFIELSEAAAAGDRGALEALLERFLPELRAYVRLRSNPMIRAQESSSDLVQSVCRELLENAERFRYPDESGFKAWLFSSALRKIHNRNEYYLALKRDVGRNRAEASSAEETAADRRVLEVYQSFSTPSRRASLREEMERVEAAFDVLTDEQRDVVVMAHLLGMSRVEIAEKLGKTEVGVRVTLHRALARLSGVLGPDGEVG